MSQTQASRQLNEWAESLGGREVDYLLAEAHRGLELDQQNFSALDARVVAIVGWAIVGVGTLLIAGDVDLNLSSRVIFAMLVIIGASLSVFAGMFTLWPRSWASKLDLSWYSSWRVPEAHSMKARSLAALIHGATLNRRMLEQRTRGFQVAAAGLVLEFAALVGTLASLAPAG